MTARTWLRGACGLIALWGLMSTAAQAQAFFDDMGACTGSSPLGPTYTTAIASGAPIPVTLYPLANASCPNWTLSGGGYLAKQVPPGPGQGTMPAPATQAIWLNENGGTMTRTVSGLTVGQTYTVSVQTWTDDIDGPTTLRLEFGPEVKVLNLAANQGPQPLSATLCARNTSLQLLMRQEISANTSPVVTNVRLVDDAMPCLFTVSFVPNGGSAVAPQTNVEYDAQATQPAPPTLAGHVFDGWFTDAALTTPYVFSTPVTQDVTLYARWQAGPGYTVGGQVNGLPAGAGNVGLANSNGDTLNVPGGGFTFPAALATGANYNVTVTSQPAGYTCTVTANGGGAVANANVTNVVVTCVAAVVPAVPTLGHWALVLLALGVALVAGRVMRARGG